MKEYLENDEPSTADFRESAEKSQDAGIADESAAYGNAVETGGKSAPNRENSEGEAEGHPS